VLTEMRCARLGPGDPAEDRAHRATRRPELAEGEIANYVVEPADDQALLKERSPANDSGIAVTRPAGVGARLLELSRQGRGVVDPGGTPGTAVPSMEGGGT